MNSFGHITPALRARDREKTENEEFLIIPNLLKKKIQLRDSLFNSLKKNEKRDIAGTKLLEQI